MCVSLSVPGMIYFHSQPRMFGWVRGQYSRSLCRFVREKTIDTFIRVRAIGCSSSHLLPKEEAPLHRKGAGFEQRGSKELDHPAGPRLRRVGTPLLVNIFSRRKLDQQMAYRSMLLYDEVYQQ